jgi:diguanylate cyclase (GGDEF)-like protein
MNDITRRFEELKTGGMLPSPKGVALAVLETAGRANSSIRDISRLIQVDPAMSGRILRYANAAYLGTQRRIVSLSQAVTFLGLFRVRQIALGFSLIDNNRRGGCVAFDYEAYWTCSLATGIAAQRLAVHAQTPPDESFTCGLLSGVGRLALATAFPKKYSEILQKNLSGPDLTHAERQQFGIDHAELSAEMLTSWGLPAMFTNAVRHHENLAEATFVPGSRAYALSSVLHFAMRIGQLLNLDETRRWQIVPSIFNAAAQIGMAEEDVPPLVEEVVASWQGWAKDLKLPSKAYSDVRTLLAAPPPEPHNDDDVVHSLLPIRVALILQNPQRAETLASIISTLGVQASQLDPTDLGLDQLKNEAPDVVILDVSQSEPTSLARLQEVKKSADRSLHIIALIPDDEEARATSILSAGAADYLLYSYTASALIARLSNAQRLIALQSAVRAERELAVSSSGDWARSNRRLLHDALTDPLTQLPNRRYGLDRFAQEWAIASSNGLPIACLMLDIDHFKKVNDTYGHDVGDNVLQQVAAMIEQSCRRNDIVYRYGGEEFCVICPGAASLEALNLAERITSVIRAARFGMNETKLPVTISIGVAVRTPAMSDVNTLIAAADRALYAAKSSGRDRVVVADMAQPAR